MYLSKSFVAINKTYLFSMCCLNRNYISKKNLYSSLHQHIFEFRSNHLTKSVTCNRNTNLIEPFICTKLRKQSILSNVRMNINLKFCKDFTFYQLFHTSEIRKVHPIVWYALKPILKLVAVLSGRGFRKWWKDLPLNKKKYFLSVLKENKEKIGIAVLMVAFFSLFYYIAHIEETPITKRKRFMAFNKKQLEKINEFEFHQIMEKLGKQILPENHPATRRVQRVVNRILVANRDIKEMKGKKWGIAVINSPIENAFVLPVGYVFVFSGMLGLCSNDDQLGIVLSHEIAHCLQNHGAENLSFVHLLDLISILIISLIWAVLPSDSMSLLTHWLYQKSLEIFLTLPYNRKIETEADYVGLQLAAKACFDVRESSAFWSKMAILKQSSHLDEPEIEFLSTHPSHASRSEYLDKIMDEALCIRTAYGCPRLINPDPRNNIERISKSLRDEREIYFKQNPKPIDIFQV